MHKRVAHRLESRHNGTMVDISKYPKKLLLNMLEQMLRIRRFEEVSGQAYGLRKIGGFCHLYIGQEAVAVGSIAACDMKKDHVLTSYRDHGHALTCGMPSNIALAELFGKESGCSRGKGGSMHLFDVEHHMFGGNGIVGAQMPVAAGVAFASKYKKDGGVTLCYFGDGAIHQGAFHETMNLSAIWHLPLIMVVENNHYGMGTSVERVSKITDFDIKAQGYGLRGQVVDGMDVLNVYEAFKKARAAAAKGESQLLDIKTYRYRGHSMSDPAKYRTKDELQKFKTEDPIVRLRHDMEEAKMITGAQFTELDDTIKQEMKQAEKFAEQSNEPPMDALYEDVLA